MDIAVYDQRIEKDQLLNCLPHRDEMFLLTRATRWDVVARTITCEYEITKDCIFYEEDSDGIPSWVGFELLAQTICALTGIEFTQKGLEPPPGMILSVSNFKAEKPYLNAGVTCVMDIKEDFCDKEAMTYCYDCNLYENTLSDAPVITAKITVMETEDMEAFFKKTAK